MIRVGAAALVVMGVLGEQTSSPDWGSIDHRDCAWLGAGGEVTSPNPASGSQGATIRPLVGFSVDTLTAFNPRRVDLHELVVGCWGERTSPRRGIKHRYVCMVVTGSMPISTISFGGYNGGAQQPPCQVRWYYHLHLAAFLNAGSCLQGSQRKRVKDPHLAVNTSGSVIA